MTIREYVGRRGRLVRNLSFFWIVLPVALVFAFPVQAKTSGIAWLVVGYLAMVAVRYAIAWQTKCPRCSASLHKITMKAAGPNFGGTIDSCPHCGVSLDEPMESPASLK
jgi:hypothetical protein